MPLSSELMGAILVPRGGVGGREAFSSPWVPCSYSSTKQPYPASSRMTFHLTQSAYCLCFFFFLFTLLVCLSVSLGHLFLSLSFSFFSLLFSLLCSAIRSLWIHAFPVPFFAFLPPTPRTLFLSPPYWYLWCLSLIFPVFSYCWEALLRSISSAQTIGLSKGVLMECLLCVKC